MKKVHMLFSLSSYTEETNDVLTLRSAAQGESVAVVSSLSRQVPVEGAWFYLGCPAWESPSFCPAQLLESTLPITDTHFIVCRVHTDTRAALFFYFFAFNLYSKVQEQELQCCHHNLLRHFWKGTNSQLTCFPRKWAGAAILNVDDQITLAPLSVERTFSQ